MLLRQICTVICFVALCASTANSQSANDPYYPIVKIPEITGAVALVDGIDARTPLSFERMLAENPGVTEILLNSGGGDVLSGLAVASRVHALGLTTTIPEDAVCFSACSFIFFAGKQRQAFGQLGVHQIAFSGGGGNLVDGQYAIADILDVLNRFDVHPNIFAVMFRTPPEDMYVFSREENQIYGFLENAPRARNDVAPNTALILEPVTTTQASSWFVVAGSYPHDRFSEARAREEALRNAGVAVTLIDTDDYSNFTNGLFAIVVGPTTKAAAEQNLESVRRVVSDAYIKTGIR